jgi:hypothetical protein
VARATRKKTEAGAAPEVAVANALADDLAAGLEAVKAGGAKGAELPPPSLSPLIEAIRTPLRARAQASLDEARQARVAGLEGELQALETEVAALESADPLPAPDLGDADVRVLDGSLRDGATGTPLAAASVVLHATGDVTKARAATATDERGRFQLVAPTADAAGAEISVLDSRGDTVTSVSIPPADEAGGDLHLELPGARLPSSLAFGEHAAELSATLAGGSRARIETVRAELELLKAGGK